jgi:predicted RNA binding protein with dsRBD fold (UPF0201 family)
MGLFGRKKYEKNVSRDNSFLKDFAIKLNGLMRYTEENERVTTALRKLQEDFQFTVATQVKDAKKVEARINELYESLKAMLQQPEWDEQAVILAIRNIGLEIDEINAMRK